MERISGWIERLLMPKLNEISGEIKTVYSPGYALGTVFPFCPDIQQRRRT